MGTEWSTLLRRDRVINHLVRISWTLTKCLEVYWYQLLSKRPQKSQVISVFLPVHLSIIYPSIYHISISSIYLSIYHLYHPSICLSSIISIIYLYHPSICLSIIYLPLTYLPTHVSPHLSMLANLPNFFFLQSPSQSPLFCRPRVHSAVESQDSEAGVSGALEAVLRL